MAFKFFVATVRCVVSLALTLLAVGCACDWPAFRHNSMRTGGQLHASALSNPSAVPGLHVAAGWPFQPTGAQAFRASPTVYKGRVFIGNANGRFYAVDAVSGAMLWQYPAATAPALTSQFTCNPSSEGIASSSAIATIGGVTAVIFAAPDRSIGAGLGSGPLFALDAATGSEVWKSPEVARLTGTTWASASELHEQIGYSSPLIANGRVYVGVANHCDNPIQNGRIVALDLATGAIDPAFSYASTNTRGGGIWSSVSATPDGAGVIATTGNARCWNGGCQAEPSANHSLSMVRVDAATGALIWKHQPVPFSRDDDPEGRADVDDATCHGRGAERVRTRGVRHVPAGRASYHHRRRPDRAANRGRVLARARGQDHDSSRHHGDGHDRDHRRVKTLSASAPRPGPIGGRSQTVPRHQGRSRQGDPQESGCDHLLRFWRPSIVRSIQGSETLRCKERR